MLLAPTLLPRLLAVAAAAGPAGSMHVVAHEDDDLLFMNPGIDAAITQGAAVTTVYLTAGDAGRNAAYWQDREAGERAAYAAMAGVTDLWKEDRLDVEGVRLARLRLAAAPRVTLLFMRLRDACDETCPKGPAASNLSRLWEGSVSSHGAVDGSAAASRDGVIALLAALMRVYAPVHLHLLDSTGAHGDDHPDHRASALFGAAAAERAGIRDVVQHRGYNILDLPPNLPNAAATRKAAIFARYQPHDTVLCPHGPPCHLNPRYAAWMHRMY
ncbi:MAG TPA: PIG-L family deacetylase [Myxococcota bacterium]|nr:PIG-L family deacetylase [Myxococcota bacterium]